MRLFKQQTENSLKCFLGKLSVIDLDTLMMVSPVSGRLVCFAKLSLFCLRPFKCQNVLFSTLMWKDSCNSYLLAVVVGNANSSCMCFNESLLFSDRLPRGSFARRAPTSNTGTSRWTDWCDRSDQAVRVPSSRRDAALCDPTNVKHLKHFVLDVSQQAKAQVLIIIWTMAGLYYAALVSSSWCQACWITVASCLARKLENNRTMVNVISNPCAFPTIAALQSKWRNSCDWMYRMYCMFPSTTIMKNANSPKAGTLCSA